MKPKKFVDPKKRLSSPKLKQFKHSGREKALARWGDGLFYIVNIVQSYEAKKKCVVQYEDRSQSTVLLKDVLKESCSGAPKCHSCGITAGEVLVVCSNCERGYHKKCHKPAIEADDTDEFVCRICVFASCAQPGGAKSSGSLGEKFKTMKRTFPYDERYLTWDASHVTNVEQSYCYCGGPGDWYNKMMQCCKCRQWFHEACVHCIDGALLVGDRFYMFACAHCNGEEFVARIDMNWLDIAQVSLFHLIMTYGSRSLLCGRFVDLEDHLIPFVKARLGTFGLARLLLDGRHSQVVIIRQELTKLLTKSSLFINGGETKKKTSWFSLRDRIPPSPPAFNVPSQGQLSVTALEEIGGRKTYLFTPVKFTTSVPYIFKGPHKAVPPTIKLKVKVNKYEDPWSDTSCHESSPSPSHGEIDGNNNSPVKREMMNGGGDVDTLQGSVDALQGVDALRGTLFKTEPLEVPTTEEQKVSAPHPVKEEKKGWCLERAVPFPPNFRGENNPFLTQFEQQSLRRQKDHFKSMLTRLSVISKPAALFDSPAVMPALDTSSPSMKKAKGFNGELVPLIENQTPASPTDKSDNPPSPDKAALSLTLSLTLSSSPTKEMLVFEEPANRSSPGRVVKHRRSSGKNENSFRNSPEIGLRKFKSIFKASPRDGLKELPIPSDSATQNGKLVDDDELKKLKALSKCLKSLTPTCGFKFPVLDKKHPSGGDLEDEKLTSGDILLQEEQPIPEAVANKPIRKRGKKRSHAQLLSSTLVNTEPFINTESSVLEGGGGGGGEDTVRRSHRSRRDVKRFEATLDNSFDGLARATFLPTDVGQDSMYDVLSLRCRGGPGGRVDYLVCWAQ